MGIYHEHYFVPLQMGEFSGLYGLQFVPGGTGQMCQMLREKKIDFGAVLLDGFISGKASICRIALNMTSWQSIPNMKH